MSTPLLIASNLKKHYPVGSGLLKKNNQQLKAVDGISLEINSNEVLGIVGESGCGKSTLARVLMHLESATAGEIIFDGKKLSQLSSAKMKPYRQEIQMVFQDPFESLNSRHNVQQILQEPLDIHRIGDKTSRLKAVKSILKQVGLPEESLTKFPHEFSGGQRQRIGIARALILKPKLLICDEPVSALDVSVQAQIINLLLTLKKDMGLSIIFISHDLSVVHHIADKVMVMYLGKTVEIAPPEVLYQQAKHPYTQSLIDSIPSINLKQKKQVKLLEGDVPSPINLPSGCRFHTRCPHVEARCKTEEPTLIHRQQKISKETQTYACHFPLHTEINDYS